MTLESLIVFLLIGAVAGWLAGLIVKGFGFGIVGNIVIGIVGAFIEDYNCVRLHSAIGYVSPKDKLEGRAEEIWKARDEKLEAARARRALKREEGEEATR